MSGGAEAPDLVMENYPEDMAAKQSLFSRLEAAYGGHPTLLETASALSFWAKRRSAWACWSLAICCPFFVGGGWDGGG